jgi:hypothetical protein
MPAPYTTLAQNGTRNLYDLFKFVSNDTTGGLLAPVLLFSFWIISFIGSVVEGRQASRAFIFASFIGAIIGILFALIGVMASQYMYFMFLMVGIGVIWYKLDNAPGI